MMLPYMARVPSDVGSRKHINFNGEKTEIHITQIWSEMEKCFWHSSWRIANPNNTQVFVMLLSGCIIVLNNNVSNLFV